MKEDLKIERLFNIDIMKKWLAFREEELSTMNEEDKKHLLHIDEAYRSILKLIPENSHTAVKKELDDMYDSFVDYSTHWNEKYYIAGFSDALKLVISSLNANNN